MTLSMKNMTNASSSGAMAAEDVRRAFRMISGKWKLEILWLLYQRVHRFGELKRALPGITQHMLTTQLRELEADGLVSRQIFAEVPPRVEYTVTAAIRGREAVWRGLVQWCRLLAAAPTAKARPQTTSASTLHARRASR
jgi:DNA-binding HxlR family transcriptional regulator